MQSIIAETRPQTPSKAWHVGGCELCVGVFAAAQIVVWTLAPALSHDAVPLDVAESSMWGHEWIVGSLKHPNLPGWLLEAARLLTGTVGWPVYLLPQIFVATTFLIVFGLGRDMMDARRAAAGTLLLSAIYYFNLPTVEFNHNIAQMPFWAAITWMLWHLRTRPSVALWLVLGMVAALSLYAKLSAGLLLFVAGLWLLWDRPLRRQLLTLGPWLGLFAFALCCVPLVNWLMATRFSPLTYAIERSGNADLSPSTFAAAQILACLGLIAMATMVGLIDWRRPLAAQRGVLTAPKEAIPIVPFLAVMTLAPVGLVTLSAAVAGGGVKAMWGAPMFSLAGLLAVALAPAPVSEIVLRRLAMGAAILLAVLPCAYTLDTLYEARFTHKPKRANWPEAEIQARFDKIWYEATGKPLNIIAGDHWVAGPAALRAGPMPSVLTNGQLDQSPWITQQRLQTEGALVLWQIPGPYFPNPPRPQPPGINRLVAGRQTGIETFAWPRFPEAPPLQIGYAILPPDGSPLPAP